MENVKGKILVIDDEAGVRDFLAYELGRQGYSVTVCADGLEAVEKVKHESFQVAISDLKMPKIDGVETLSRLKAIDPDLMVIIATGFGALESAIQCLRLGAFDYISKPFSLDELTTCLERALEHRELKTMINFYQTSQIVHSYLSIDELLVAIIPLIRRTLTADEISIMLKDRNGKLYIAAAYGLEDEYLCHTRLAIGERVAGRVAQWQVPTVLQGGLRNDSRFSDLEGIPGINSSIVFPLMSRSGLVGILNMNRTVNTYPFTDNDLRPLGIFATQIAQAIDNARLHSELQEKMRQMEQMHAQLVQSEKLSSIGLLAAGMAHELNNPLTAVLGNVQLVMQDLGTEHSVYNELCEILKGAARCQTIIQDILRFSRQEVFACEPINIENVISDALKLIERELELHNISLERIIAPQLSPVLGSVHHLQQVFLNITINALQAMPEGGVLSIITEQTGSEIKIKFTDTGQGIPPDILPKIFDPFFTTKEVGKGTGLGLSVCHGILREHQGSIEARNEPEHGAAFVIKLPAAGPPLPGSANMTRDLMSLRTK